MNGLDELANRVNDTPLERVGKQDERIKELEAALRLVVDSAVTAWHFGYDENGKTVFYSIVKNSVIEHGREVLEGEK